ncbi:hypothetical protein PAPYR_12051 [Paratrimastix pyriformis]|uniref:Uncharacterized protein n=1 Tax=Paratrimastix pyriformis TaxID=342808 RepID=A0ABQ8U807_9EUKA|nr:hypothetical protein PAPYR_12051 [Paratrimastix pyriformis]
MRKGFTSFDHRARRERHNLATLHMVTTLGRAHIGHPVSPGTPQTAVPAEKYPVNFQARQGGRLPWQQQREIAAPMCTFLSRPITPSHPIPCSKGHDGGAPSREGEHPCAHTYAPTGLTHWDRGTSKAGGQLHRLLPHCGLLYLVVNENQTVFWIKEKITPDAFSSGFGVFEGTWLSAILQAAVPEWSLNCNNPTTETLSKPSPAATRGQWCPLRTSKRNENEKRIWNGFENSRASQKRSPLPPNLNIRTSDSNLAHVAPKKIHAGGSDYQMWFVPNDQTFSWSQATLLALRFLFLELPPTAYCKILSGYLCDFSPLRFPMALLTIAAAAAARGIIETLLLPKPPGK